MTHITHVSDTCTRRAGTRPAFTHAHALGACAHAGAAVVHAFTHARALAVFAH